MEIITFKFKLISNFLHQITSNFKIMAQDLNLGDENIKNEMIRLCKEANELVAIIVASINTAKSKLK